MILDLFFDRVVIITLRENEARARRAQAELELKRLSSKAQLFYGVRGSVCLPPAWWGAGKGAWGCMQSHLRVVQDALMDGVENLLIIEDDCVWQTDANKLVFEFLAQLPGDWEQVYFGGQHRSNHKPEQVRSKPAAWVAKSVHRTHAYGLKRSVMQKFCQHIMHAPDYLGQQKHVDHQLEEAHRKNFWKTYAPSFWLAGQGENRSDINNNYHFDKWWHVPVPGCENNLPIIVCSKEPDISIKKRLHFGRHISPECSLIDEGLFICEISQTEKIIGMIAREAYAHQQLPAMFDIKEKVELLREKWPGGVIYVEDLTIDGVADLCDYIKSKNIKHPWINP